MCDPVIDGWLGGVCSTRPPLKAVEPVDGLGDGRFTSAKLVALQPANREALHFPKEHTGVSMRRKHTSEGKKCKACEVFKPLQEFYENKRIGTTYYYSSECKHCKTKYNANRLAIPEVKIQNRIMRNNRHKNRYKTEPMYRLRKILRDRFKKALQRAKVGKGSNKSLELLGCSPHFLFEHLAKQLPEGAKWEDYHVDHIRPVSSFDLTNEQHMKECWNWRNLQLLTAHDNLTKGSKWELTSPTVTPSDLKMRVV